MSSRRILVIDDNEDLRSAIERLFTWEGFQVLTASDGQAGLGMLREMNEQKNPVHLIFLDLNMPVMSGQEFLEAARKEDLLGVTPVVIFAAGRNREPLEGVSDWLTKPVDIEELLLAAERWCKPNPSPDEFSNQISA